MAALVPPGDGDCCGSGCERCVWDVYYQGLEEAAAETTSTSPQVRTAPVAARDPFEPPQNCVRIVCCDEYRTPPLPYGLAECSVSSVRSFGSIVSVDLGVCGGCDQEVLPLFVPNPPEVVKPLLERLKFDPERVVKVAPNAFSAGVNAPTYPHWIPQDTALKVADIFTWHVDVTSRASVRQQVLWIMSEFAADESERARLKLLSTPGGVAAYREKFRARDTLASLSTALSDFPSSSPPLARLLSSLPQLHPRLYSNASPATSPPSLLVSRCRPFEGHASSQLRGFKGGDKVFVGGPVPAGLRRLVEERSPAPPPGVPVVVVAAGSGLAPVIRMLRVRGGGEGVVLYYGCRGEADVPFPTELPELASTVCVALSGADPKRYVWHLLQRDADTLRPTLQLNSCHVVLCGPPAMMRDTEATLCDILGGTEALSRMKDERRWWAEVWGATAGGS